MNNDLVRIAVVGLGNIGHAAIEAIFATPDMELAGIVRRHVSGADGASYGVPVVSDVTLLEKVDVALLCGPTRTIPKTAPIYLRRGISTVDGFDIHGQPLWALRESLDVEAKAHGCVAVVSAGWDPGTDSLLRTLFLAMAPRGLTHTNFGPGMSMGHSVAAKSKPGVKDALSMTIPLGSGVHRRMVYVTLEEGADFESVKKAILEDAYFAHDETRVAVVPDVEVLKDMGHGVRMERRGVSGQSHNQHFEFTMRINNPALTAQIMVASARAAVRRLSPGAYTLPEIAPMDLLPGDRADLIRLLV